VPKKWNLKSRLIACIRKTWLFSPLRREIVKRAKVDKYYRCEKCKGMCDKIQIDHILPVIDPEVGWQGYNSFIERTFCDPANLQALCKKCHIQKTKKENKSRKKK